MLNKFIDSNVLRLSLGLGTLHNSKEFMTRLIKLFKPNIRTDFAINTNYDLDAVKKDINGIVLKMFSHLEKFILNKYITS